jgi:hypothetical protein
MMKLRKMHEERRETEIRIISKWISRKQGKECRLGWTDQDQDMDQWQAVVYMVLNLQVP